MNDHYESISLQFLNMEVLRMVTDNTRNGCGRCGEGRKKVGGRCECQELLFVHVKGLKSICYQSKLKKQNYRDDWKQILCKAMSLDRIT